VIELVRVLRRKGAQAINLNVNKLRTRSCIIDGEAAATTTAGRASTAFATGGTTPVSSCTPSTWSSWTATI